MKTDKTKESDSHQVTQCNDSVSNSYLKAIEEDAKLQKLHKNLMLLRTDCMLVTKVTNTGYREVYEQTYNEDSWAIKNAKKLIEDRKKEIKSNYC